MSSQKVMLVFVSSLWRHLWKTIKLRSNLLCNPLLGKIKKLLISGQFFRQSSWKLVQNEKDYGLTQKFLNFCKIVGGRWETRAPFWCHFPKFFKAVSKQYIATKQQWKVLKIRSSVIFVKFGNSTILKTS